MTFSFDPNLNAVPASINKHVNQAVLEELSKEELIQLVLKLREENLRLKQRISELEEKLAALKAYYSAKKNFSNALICQQKFQLITRKQAIIQ